MSTLFALIIIVMVWFFVIAPFIRLIRVSRQWQNSFKQARNQQQQRQQQQQQRNRQPERSKKKIDPNVGEYVEFTETTTTQSDTDAAPHTPHTHTEQQITDVTWEDLPAKKPNPTSSCTKLHHPSHNQNPYQTQR